MARKFRFGQGAIEWTSLRSSTAGSSQGQGATEYLVLLAVVLIIALVGVALLGFFPGTASDAQLQESRIYWQSASPIAIVEMDAHYATGSGGTLPYLRVRNVGAYPIRITKLIGENSNGATQFHNGTAMVNIADYYYLGPGEEAYFGATIGIWGGGFTVPAARYIDARPVGSCSSSNYMICASQLCSTTAVGTLQINNFAFEYIQYVEGQQITKRQIGKALVLKCSG